MSKLHKILSFYERQGSVGGALVQFQSGEGNENVLPFPLNKVLIMYDIKEGDVRGKHAHYKTEEIFLVLEGKCTVIMDNGKGIVEEVELSSETQNGMKSALLLYPHVWRTVKNFAEDTRLLAITNRPHDENDYIRDYDQFCELAKTWTTLGGSSASS